MAPKADGREMSPLAHVMNYLQQGEGLWWIWGKGDLIHNYSIWNVIVLFSSFFSSEVSAGFDETCGQFQR